MVTDLPYERIAPLDILGLLRVLWHGKWVVALIAAAFVCAAGYYAFHMTSPQFAATATLQLDAKPGTLRDVSHQWPDPATDAASLNTQVRLLTSDKVLQDVITDLELLADPEFNRYLTPATPFALNSIRARIRAAMTGQEPDEPSAEAIAQKTIENLRGRLTAHRPNDTLLFQVTARSSDADKAAIIANSVARASITAQIAAREHTADTAVGWLTQRVNDLQQKLNAQETAVTTLIASVQIQEEAALDTLSTAVLAIDQERATAAATLAMYQTTSPASARQTAEITQLRDQIAEIEARRERLRAQLAAQSAGMVRLQQMQREADTTRVLYQSFLARLQETQVQRGLAYADSRLITPAMAGRYVGPQKVLIMMAALLLGTVTGIGAVVLRQGMRRGFDTPQALRNSTGLPVYAQIPKRRHHATMEKQMRKITAGLLLDGQGDAPQVTVVTSSVHGEARADIAFGLASTLAAGGKTVLLVHSDSKPMQKRAGKVTTAHLTCRKMPLGNVHELCSQVAAWRAAYAHIIIIAPPVLSDIETQLLAQNGDAVLYAVRWGHTAQTSVQDGLARIAQASDAPIGLVLSQTHPRQLRRFAAIQGGAASAWA